jgi:hypothetical protein
MDLTASTASVSEPTSADRIVALESGSDTVSITDSTLSLLANDQRLLLQRVVQQRKLLAKLLEPNFVSLTGSIGFHMTTDSASDESLSHDSNEPSENDDDDVEEEDEDDDRSTKLASKTVPSSSSRTAKRPVSNLDGYNNATQSSPSSGVPEKRLKSSLISNQCNTSTVALNETLLNWLSLSTVRCNPLLSLPQLNAKQCSTASDTLDSLVGSTLSTVNTTKSTKTLNETNPTTGSASQALCSVRNQFDHSGLDLALLQSLLQVLGPYIPTHYLHNHRCSCGPQSPRTNNSKLF